MTVNVGTMQLPVPEDPDAVRTYLNGTHVSGGLWTALTRSSNHDHSGGTNGIQLTATSIPDGSITTAKLDPAVLGPYALVDGSKPFTGTVTMSADTLVRDTLRFGAKPAGVADATLSRTGPGALRVDTHLGVGVAPAAWDGQTQYVTAHFPQGVSLASATWGAQLRLTANATTDATGDVWRAHHDGYSGQVVLAQDGSLSFSNTVTNTAGATLAWRPRLALAPTGTLTLTPDAGQAAVTTAGDMRLVAGGVLYLRGATYIQVETGTQYVIPVTDNAVYNGAGSNRWTAVYAVNGTIQTSSSSVKEGITPLDPAACYQAAKDVRWYEFAYLPPAYQEPEPPPEIAYDASDDNETKAEKKAKRDEAEAQAKAAHLKMVAETAPARNQRGFVFPTGAESKDEAGGTLPPVPDLFGLSDRESTTPQADLATLGCALQEVIRRLETLEGAAA